MNEPRPAGLRHVASAFVRIGWLEAVAYPVAFLQQRLQLFGALAVFAVLSGLVAGGSGDYLAFVVVGLAASVGAGISMGFTEAASDDGQLSGRGSPIKRGFASGIMTTVGGLGHALPYLIPDFWTATVTAFIVVFIELWAIAWIQNKYMDTPFFRAAMQVVLGGALVFAAGVLIGSG